MLSFFVLLMSVVLLDHILTPTPVKPEMIEVEVVAPAEEEEPTKETEDPVVPLPKEERPVVPKDDLPSSGPTQETTPVPHVTSIAEYEDLVMGLCPSQRPHTNFDEYDGLLPAIGLKSTGYTDNGKQELKKWVEVYWSAIRTNRSFYPDEVSVGSISQFGLSYQAISFYIHYPTLSVIYHNTWSDEGYVMDKVREKDPELIAELDQLATEMTSHLRYIDSAYNAKCPND